MKFWISPYELESARPLNSRTDRRIYRGALVRIGSGYACLHPWPELGDAGLEECFADLAGEQRLPLVKRSRHCAKVDGQAREDGRSLFEGLEIPDSHFLMPELSEGKLEESIARGFSVVKVKAGRDIGKEMEEIRVLGALGPGVKWRVDFNERGKCPELREILAGWTREELARIDFLEDPSPFDPKEWGTLPVGVANDREMARDRGSSQVLVVKPAVDEIPVETSQRIVVTSYLDHPLGQCFAAYEAGRAGVREICGLQSHFVYSATEFSEKLGELGPGFQGPVGTGLGFDELLEGLDWREYVA